MPPFRTDPDPEREHDASLAPLTRPLSLRETVLEQLRTAIITGRLPEGELVSAPALGQALGVSATPVREAMMDLAREGLVETLKNKGFRVTTLGDRDLDDLAQIRLLLEPPAMRFVVGQISEAELPGLQRLADSCLRAAERADLEAYLRNDREFHARVLSFTGNEQLVELASSLRRRTRLYGIGSLAREGRLVDSAREHHELVELLVAGDAAAAETLLSEHISRSRTLWAAGTASESAPSV